MYLFFDTETTGLPKNHNAPLSDSRNWPRMVQIAWLLADEDGTEKYIRDYIIKPEGFVIPPQAVKIHGITTEKANEEGVQLESVLNEFALTINSAEMLVAHNFDFDVKIIGAEFIRKNISSRLFKKPFICTMKSTTNFCKIPGNYGYKWPTLTELYYTLFRSDFKEAHNALFDVKSLAKCFFELKRLNVFS